MGRLTPVRFEDRPRCGICSRPMFQHPLGAWQCAWHPTVMPLVWRLLKWFGVGFVLASIMTWIVMESSR